MVLVREFNGLEGAIWSCGVDKDVGRPDSEVGPFEFVGDVLEISVYVGVELAVLVHLTSGDLEELAEGSTEGLKSIKNFSTSNFFPKYSKVE